MFVEWVSIFAEWVSIFAEYVVFSAGLVSGVFVALV